MRSSLPRVGLFGAYHATNFGDDLMAMMFGRTLDGLGTPPTIYGLGKEYQERYGFRVVPSVLDLVEASDVIVVGGGGLLQPRSGRSAFAKELDLLLTLCREREIPIFCFSIGGAALPLAEIRPPARQQLVRQAEYVTLRLRTELPLLEQAGTKGAHHEDVVWTTPSFFPALPRRAPDAGRPTVGISLYDFGWFGWLLIRTFLHLLVRARPDCDFLFIESRFAAEGKMADRGYRPDALLRRPNCRFHKFESVEDGVRCLQTVDLLLTNRLHLGVTAMSFGVPYVGLLPRPKTVSYLEELGLGDFCWTWPRLWRLVTLLTPGGVTRIVRNFGELDLDPIRTDAQLHYRDLEQRLGELPPSTRS